MHFNKNEAVIRDILAHHLDFDRTFVFLFGSRADERAHPASDYDVGLYGEQKIPLKTIALIKDQLDELPIAVSVDVIDFRQVSAEFKQVALRKIKTWNQPKMKNLSLR